MSENSDNFLASSSNRNTATRSSQKRKLKGKKVGKGKTTRQASKKQAAVTKNAHVESPVSSAAEKFFSTEVSDDEEIRNPANSLKSSQASSYHFSFDSSESSSSRSKGDVKAYQATGEQTDTAKSWKSDNRNVNIDADVRSSTWSSTASIPRPITIQRHNINGKDSGEEKVSIVKKPNSKSSTPPLVGSQSRPLSTRPRSATLPFQPFSTTSKQESFDSFVPKMKPRKKTPVTPKRIINRHNCDDDKDVTRSWQPRDIAKRNHPDVSVPLCVISERHQDQISTSVNPEEELYKFGEVYDTNMLHLIHKYLEVDVFHRVVYVGPERGSIAEQVQKHFCLINKILSVYPGKIDYADVKENKKLLAFKIANVGAEEFFCQAAKDEAYKTAPFHRVVIHDSIPYFNDMKNTLKNIIQVLHKFGKILIIHRPGSLNTLPYFSTAKTRISENDIPYMDIITALQKMGADVEWDLVHVPLVIDTSKWLAMLKAKYPPQMEIMSNYEITCGLRELSEGPLKYLHGKKMELEDRLMFITASHPTFDCAYPAVQRVGGASQVPYSGLADSKYYLPISDDIKMFIEKPKTISQETTSLF